MTVDEEQAHVTDDVTRTSQAAEQDGAVPAYRQGQVVVTDARSENSNVDVTVIADVGQ